MERGLMRRQAGVSDFLLLWAIPIVMVVYLKPLMNH